VKAVSVTEELVERLRGTQIGDIPEAALDVARQVCLDGLAVMVAGAGEPLGLGRITTDYVRALGGPADSTVIGGGFKTSALNAAYANGTFGHALDFDNTWWPLNHPTSPTLPAIMAIAERDGLSGAEVLRAIVLAFEVQGRMRVASARIDAGTRFHKPGVSGLMGAVTGAGVLLGLEAHPFLMAFGLAGSRAGSVSVNTGTMTKSSHSGHAARMGVECATLAGMGWTANDDIFGRGGFLQLFYGEEYVDQDLFLKDFGAPYRMIEPGVGFKKHPANYFTHRPIDASIALAERHDLDAAEIERVVVDFPCFEYVNRPVPATGLDGKFSVQYATAIALLDRRVKVASFSDARRFAPDVEALLPKITLNMREDIRRSFQDCFAIVRVTMRDGTTHEERCDRPRGMWGLPLTRDERLAKVRDCCDGALPDAQVDALIAMVEALAGASSVGPLMDVLRSATPLTPEA
jgi:aconitate decarboxylase